MQLFIFFCLSSVGHCGTLPEIRGQNMENKVKISVTLPPDLVDEVSRRAACEHRSLSGQVSYFLALAVGQTITKPERVAQ
jgi:hypothetical protein